MAENVRRLPLAPAQVLPVAKGRASYRIVHQLDPVTSLAYGALAHAVGSFLEDARADDVTACSYRFRPADGAFFSGGAGYENFRIRSRELAETHDYGASIDIADFYNQIYSHRVRASIEASGNGLEGLAADVESVIHAVNSGASKGIPVGCDPSALMAEGIMIDVDQLIARYGVRHTRYVDDIRMYSDDPQRLLGVIESISEYLYDHHRLHLNASKTRLLPQEEFIERVLLDHFDAETEAAMNRLGQLNPYGNDDLDEGDVPEEEILDEIGEMIEARMAEDGYVDLNLVKAFARRARRALSASLVPVAISSLEAFVPAIHELVPAMDALATESGTEIILPLVQIIRQSPHYRRKAVRRWMDWLCAGHAGLLEVPEIREAVFVGDIRTQARAAMTSRDLAWVRERRGNFAQLPQMHRSAVLLTMRLLGQDERRYLLGQIGNDASPLDLAIKRFVW